MLKNFSNQVKALLLAEDMTELAVVSQDNCMTVQHFDYRCCRSRNDSGIPYGPTVSVIMNISVKSLSNTGNKIFYERLKSNLQSPFTVIFNATFDDYRKLSYYEDAMIVSGYVVDVEEAFDSSLGTNGETEQMLLQASLLLCSITYVGKNSNRTLSIIR